MNLTQKGSTDVGRIWPQILRGPKSGNVRSKDCLGYDLERIFLDQKFQ